MEEKCNKLNFLHCTSNTPLHNNSCLVVTANSRYAKMLYKNFVVTDNRVDEIQFSEPLHLELIRSIEICLVYCHTRDMHMHLLYMHIAVYICVCITYISIFCIYVYRFILPSEGTPLLMYECTVRF